jgi:hypothetical protein
MAREHPGQTLQPTALVHEAWLRLGAQRFENRAHFFLPLPKPCAASSSTVRGTGSPRGTGAGSSG